MQVACLYSLTRCLSSSRAMLSLIRAATDKAHRPSSHPKSGEKKEVYCWLRLARGTEMLFQAGEQRLTTLLTDFKSGKTDLIHHSTIETTEHYKIKQAAIDAQQRERLHCSRAFGKEFPESDGEIPLGMSAPKPLGRASLQKPCYPSPLASPLKEKYQKVLKSFREKHNPQIF